MSPLLLSTYCSWVFSRAVVKLASSEFLTFYRYPSPEKSLVVIVCSYQTVSWILKSKNNPLSLLQRREQTLLRLRNGKHLVLLYQLLFP